MKPLVLFLLLLGLAVPATAEVRYAGEQTLWQDTVWEGDILIDGILTVAPEVTLEIRPGTVVRFTRIDSNADGIGESELFVQGTFLATGTADQPILFTSAENDPQPGDWGAVNMMASPEENILEHCRVEYGYRGFHAHFASARISHSLFRFNRRGAQFQESTVTISDSEFVDNYNGVQFRDSTVAMARVLISGGYWGMRCVYSTLELSDSRVENNLVNGINFRDSDVSVSNCVVRSNRRGLYLQRTRGRLLANRIVQNSEHGIFLEDSTGEVVMNLVSANGRAGFRVINSPARIADNTIVDNDEYAVINDGDNDLHVGRNWWGEIEPGQLQQRVRDGKDRTGYGLVIIEQPLEKPAL